MSSDEITPVKVSQFEGKFQSDPKNEVSQRLFAKFDMLTALERPDRKLTHVFTNRISKEGKPVANQKATGRCWIFAALNTMRTKFCKQMELDDFEFSQNYLCFWDKVERFNYLLGVLVDTVRSDEPVEGRKVQFLLSNPMNDGGQWDMVVNLVEKYGIVPKVCMPDTAQAQNTRRLNFILNNKMRECYHELQGMVRNGSSVEEISQAKTKMVEKVYSICSLTLGSPPVEFTWEYYDNRKRYQSIGPITPLEFYRLFVKPHANLEDKICLIHDPREGHPYGQTYTVDCLNNMVGGRPVVYNNQQIDVLREACARSILRNEPVWFGCDIGKDFSRKSGVNSLDIFAYENTFGESMRGLSKAQRLVYKESEVTHAMALTAVSLTKEDPKTATKWRVENSWGEEGGDKGYYAMSDEWFQEYVFEVVVSRLCVDKAVCAVTEETTPIVLPCWDPLGALAGGSSNSGE